MSTATPTVAPVLRPDGRRIRMARVLCMGCLVLIHVPPYGEVDRWLFGGPLLQFLYLYPLEALARASVPLLSVVSGFLLAPSLREGRYPGAVRRRLRSLVVPLVLWNVLRLVWIGVLDGTDALPAGPLAWANAVVGFAGFPALTPLHFLRDLFLCALLSPLIVSLLRWGRWWTVAVFLLASMSGVLDPFILSDSILPFFAAGLGLGLGLLRAGLPGRGLILAGAGLVPALTAAALVYAAHDPMPGIELAALVLSYMQRFAGAAFFWLLAGWLADRPVGAPVERLERLAFIVFCSHPFTVAAVWRAFELAGGGLSSWTYPLVLGAMPVVAFVVAAAIAGVGGRLAPGVLGLLSGGKLAGRPASDPASGRRL